MKNTIKAFVNKLSILLNVSSNKVSNTDCNYKNDYYGDQLCQAK